MLSFFERILEKIEKVQRYLDPECKLETSVSWAHTCALKLAASPDMLTIYKRTWIKLLQGNIEDSIEEVSRYWRKLWPDATRLRRLKALDRLEDIREILDMIVRK